MNTRGIIAVLILILIVIAAIWYFSSAPSAATTGGTTATSTDQNLAAAESTVQGFGMAQQQVSLMAPDASTTIAQVYAPYVDPTLLATWEADPTIAPGKVVSSPWPDHIAITNAMQTPQGYEVDGNLVMMTSTGESGEVPLVIDLQQENGQWLIVNYQALASSTAATSGAGTQ